MNLWDIYTLLETLKMASLKETPGGVLLSIRSAERLTGGVSFAARAAFVDRYQEIYGLDLLNS